jgi:hypothetical protein
MTSPVSGSNRAQDLSISSSNSSTRTASLPIGREDVDHLAAHAVGAAVQLHIVAGVLQLRQAAQDRALVDLSPRTRCSTIFR